jgi:branched-chain amino acid transport system permease protein
VLGPVEACTKLAYPEASAVVIFVVMVAILLIRPQGLFGRRS